MSEEHESVNEGTQAKQTLQARALQAMQKYPNNQTLKAYAEYLCWDLNITARTALESYIMPMLRHGYIKYAGVSQYNNKAIYSFSMYGQHEQTESPDDYWNFQRIEQLRHAIQMKVKAGKDWDTIISEIKVATKEHPLDREIIDRLKNSILKEPQKDAKNKET
jgi:hypothetical protein